MNRPIRPGRPVWLELNAQRVTQGISFYETLFGWGSRPLHVPPWGAIPNIANGSRVFGNQFMAMGSFAPPKWNIWFSAHLEHAETVVRDAGGDVRKGIHTLGNLGQMLNIRDPFGQSFAMIRLREDPPVSDQYGDPVRAECWGEYSSERVDFYANLLGLRRTNTTTGAMLADEDAPRLFFRDVPFESHAPGWIPYFRTASTGGDCERARRVGAIVQIHPEEVEHLGELIILSDPSGAYFGLVNTGE